MELFNNILFWINNVIMAIVGIAFATQLIYTLFFFVPAQKFKKAKKKHKFAIVICARNESSVIADTIKSIQVQNYPKELYDIYVVADNCTDNTKEIASNSGATVFEHNDDDPKHKRVSYALKYFFDIMLKEDKDYEAYIRFDADNFVHPDYIDKMNDAFDGGAKLARGYNNAKNLTDNIISGVSGLWYIRDCRFSCQGRSFLRSAEMMVGSGMMISSDIIKEDNGWIAMSTSEDAEFTMNQLFKKRKAVYVSEAVLYDDQPATLKDAFRRNIRMGHGLFNLCFTHGFKCLGLFFKRFKWSYLDMFFQLFFIPIALVCCTWFPLYYGYDIIYSFIVGNYVHLKTVFNVIILAIVFAFILPFILQALLVYFLDKKKINTKFSKLLPSIIMFPLFMIIYAISITIGAITKPKWHAITRSKNHSYDNFKMYENQDIIDIKPLNDDGE